ncbi:MAG: DNA ligase [Mobilicoccus sp.]|nr:DNA ligase [Mobilicoccus sp.]
MRPMLATHTDTVPDGPEWVHEVKWDGWRIIAAVTDGHLALTTRSGRDVTGAFPDLAGIVLPDLVLDGEVVAFDDNGRPSLHALADRLGGRARPSRPSARPATLLLFDLLRLEDHDLLGTPWEQRRGLLDALAPSLEHDRWSVPDTYDDGRLLLEVTREQGLEGVVSKRRNAPYRPGERSPDWLKRPHRVRTSLVVGGWRPEAGGDRLGALLLGTPTAGGTLRFRGRVGSGLIGRAGAALLPRLREADTSPFDAVPDIDARGTRWVRPELVVDVDSLGEPGARLRQPSFRAVREDLTPADIGAGDE